MDIDVCSGLYYDLMMDVERWMGKLTEKVKLLKVALVDGGCLEKLYPITVPPAVRQSRYLLDQFGFVYINPKSVNNTFAQLVLANSGGIESIR
ncbi:hypothetical protein P3L10_029287 [Capsicum annuum]